jgi:hypothetical protein
VSSIWREEGKAAFVFVKEIVELLIKGGLGVLRRAVLSEEINRQIIVSNLDTCERG